MITIDDILKNFEKSKFTIKNDSFDRTVFKNISSNSSINSIIENHDYQYLKHLLQDVFLEFYKYFPRFLPDEQILPDVQFHKTIIQKIRKTEDYRKLREITKYDEVNSAIATKYFFEFLWKELQKRNIDQRIKEFQKQKKELLRQLSHLRREGRGANQKQIQQIMQKIQNLQNLQNKIKNSISQIAVVRAVQNSLQKTNQVSAMLHSIGWGKEISSLQKVSAQERFKLAQALMKNEKLFKLINELGRLKNLLIETYKNKIRHGSAEIHDIEMGNDTGKLIATEFVKLKHPALKTDFKRRFLEGKLLQYELIDKKKKTRGSIIACYDVSGSMNNLLFDGITREIFAKAITLALLELAVRQKRKLVLIAFSENVKSVRVFDKNNKPTTQDYIDIAEEHYSGGTDFEAPLRRALEYIDSKSDILFITDGECKVSESFLKVWREKQKEMKFKIISLQVGTASTRYLEEFSDKVLNFRSLLETSKEIFDFILEGEG